MDERAVRFVPGTGGGRAREGGDTGGGRWSATRPGIARRPNWAGIPTVAVLTGGFSVQELQDAGAVAVFETLEELRQRLGETPLG
jgi:hypothetical protein